MSEISRILKERQVDASFLKPEVRCDFLVTENLKKTWLVEIDLFLEFQSLCQKHGLQCFLAYGSLLGAARHQGFIPWDDDLDVMMLREDFDRLNEIIPDIRAPYFFQNVDTDPGYGYSHYRFQNKNTTGISLKFVYHPMQAGLYIDIFPVDRFVDGDEAKRTFDKINALNRDNSTLMRMENPHLSDEDKARVSELRARSQATIADNVHEIHRLAKVHQNDNTDMYCITINTVYSYQKNSIHKEWMEGVVYLDVEGFKFPVPNGYKEILTHLYGDYLKFPPVEKRGIWHQDILFDPEVPFETKKLELMKE